MMAILVVPDESKSSRWVPLVIGTCTLGWIVKVIKESWIGYLLLGQWRGPPTC